MPVARGGLSANPQEAAQGATPSGLKARTHPGATQDCVQSNMRYTNYTSKILATSNFWEIDMKQTGTARLEEKLRSALTADAIDRVQVLQYGDDPEVEPGETAIRVFISRAGRPEGQQGDAETV